MFERVFKRVLEGVSWEWQEADLNILGSMGSISDPPEKIRVLFFSFSCSTSGEISRTRKLAASPDHSDPGINVMSSTSDSWN